MYTTLLLTFRRLNVPVWSQGKSLGRLPGGGFGKWQEEIALLFQ